MGVLRIALALAMSGLAACYAPEVPSCTVTCSEATDCVDSQDCLGGYCVGADVEACDPPAMAMPDAAAPAATTALRIEISGGKGRVGIVGGQACEMGCTITVPRGRALQLEATQLDKPFDRWVSSACGGQAAICALTPTTGMVTVAAKFGGSGGDD